MSSEHGPKPDSESYLSRHRRLLLGGAVILMLASGAIVLWPEGENRPHIASTPANNVCPQVAALPDTQSYTKVDKNVNLATAGKWIGTPGVQQNRQGLSVSHVERSIVQQDGSDGIENQPINLFGSRLAVDGDFEVTVRMAGLRDGEGAINLYAQPPMVADEDLIGCGGVRLAVEGSSFWIGAPDSQNADTSFEHKLPITPAEDHTLTIRRQHGTMSFAADNAQPVTVNRDLFSTNELWFGADAAHSYSIPELIARPLGKGTVRVVDTTSLKVAKGDRQGLQTLLNTSNSPNRMRIGAAIAAGPLVSDEAYEKVAAGGWFGSWTTENAGKMQFTQPERGTYTFGELDGIVAAAEKHGIAVHGHALVFGEANPPWVRELAASDPGQLKQVMTDHITTVVSRYKGKIRSWDVVNEPLADYDTFAPGAGALRDHVWKQAMGEQYIDQAFRTAHQADPKALLFMNEFGLEGGISDNGDTDRWDAFLGLVDRLQARGVPINGVGFQMHEYEDSDQVDSAVFRTRIQQLAKRNLLFRISEMDGDAAQGHYMELLDICRKASNCDGITFWGISDRYNWYNDDGLKQGSDLLWDKNMRPSQDVLDMQSLLRR